MEEHRHNDKHIHRMQQTNYGRRIFGLIIVCALIVSAIYFLMPKTESDCNCRTTSKDALIGSDIELLEGSDHVLLPTDYADYLQNRFTYDRMLIEQLVPMGTSYKDFIEGANYRHMMFVDQEENFVDCRCG